MLMAVCLALSLLPTAALAEGERAVAAEYGWYSGAAADATEYTISDAAQLLGFADIVNGTATGIEADSFAGKTVKLSRNIDLRGVEWTPIGKTSETAFKGTFDGGNNRISNLTIVSDTESAGYTGFFGYINGAVVRNIQFSRSTVEMNDTATGKYASVLSGMAINVVISNVSFSNVNVTVQRGSFGTVAGYLHSTAATSGTSTGNTVTNISVSNLTASAPYPAEAADKVATICGLFAYIHNQNSSLCDYYTNCDISGMNVTINRNGYVCGVTKWQQGFGSYTVDGCDVSNFNVTCNGDGVFYVAGFCGGTHGGTLTYQNSTMSGKITNNGTNENSVFAGLVYKIRRYVTHVDDVSVNVDITSSVGTSGGIFGEVSDYNKTGFVLNDCTVSGNISGSTAGGYVGKTYHENSLGLVDSTATDCTFTGTVSGNIAGGFIGQLGDNVVAKDVTFTFEDCTVDGSVNGEESTTGGFVGETSGSDHVEPVFSDCVLAGKVNGETGGALVGNVEYAASYNGTLYTTLQAAVDAVPAKGENTKPEDHVITVLKDIVIDVPDDKFNKHYDYVSIDGKTLTVNMNGKTISWSEKAKTQTKGNYDTVFALRGGANVVLTGNGTIIGHVGGKMNGCTAWLKEDAAGKLTIENGTYYGEGILFIGKNGGTINIEGGWFEDDITGDGHKQIINVSGYLGFTDGMGKSIVMTGGTLVDADPRFLNDGNAVAEGYLVSKNVVNGNNEYTVIPNKNIAAHVVAATEDYDWNHPSHTTEFKAAYGYAFPTTVTNYYTSVEAAYAAAKTGETVVPYMAEVDGVRYPTLADAVAAAQTSTNKTVKLLGDAAGAGVVFGDSAGTQVEVTIDLNGHTYTLNQSVGSSDKYGTVGFYLWAGSKVTVKNGTLKMAEDEMGDATTFFKMFHSKGDLTLTDITLDCTNGVAYDGETDKGFIAVESDDGSVTINGSTSVINCGNISPETWTLVAYDKGKFTIDTTGTIDGVVATYCGNGPIEIKNGNFVNSKENCSQLQGVSGTISVTGGTFSEDPADHCAMGYVSYKKPNGTYGVMEGSDTGNGINWNVTITVRPEGAAVVLKKGDTVLGTEAGTYQLPNGEYTLSVSQRGYRPVTRTFTVAGAAVEVDVELRRISYSSGTNTTPSAAHPVSVGAAANGSVFADPRSARKGDTVIITVTPDEGYALDTLTVTDNKGSQLELTDLGGGKFSFTMPDSQVKIAAQFAPAESQPEQIRFSDVPAGAYYEIPVLWAVEQGVTTGVGNGMFAPNGQCTRAEIVTFLWRLAGCPDPIAASAPADVDPDSYYAKAVSWAVEHGITNGDENGLFSPNSQCTRAQAVTFLYRALGASAAGKASFADVPDGVFYTDAVAWAVEHGVTSGVGGGLFNPNGICTRAEIVTFLYRAMA